MGGGAESALCVKVKIKKPNKKFFYWVFNIRLFYI